MKQGKLAVMISGEQLKTILYSLHHMLPPDECLDDEDRELLGNAGNHAQRVISNKR
ncbi:hypothetical protein KHA80_06500 [Anaerobacillus sp. HL2]|nr:hypothetical protein KHA80_06500 [Anaerobacillus sp. HL2]